MKLNVATPKLDFFSDLGSSGNQRAPYLFWGGDCVSIPSQQGAMVLGKRKVNALLFLFLYYLMLLEPSGIPYENRTRLFRLKT